MKTNNKGMTIIEILISVVLVSLILMFLFKLLMDVKREEDKTEYTIHNQLNRAEFLDLVESDLDSYELKSVKDVTNPADNLIALEISYNNINNITVFKVYKKNIGTKEVYYVSYQDTNKNISTYEMKGARVSNCGTWKMNKDLVTGNYFFIIKIPVYNLIPNNNNYEEKNNAVDDLILTNYRNKSKLIDDAQMLTNYSNYNIGGVCESPSDIISFIIT